MSRKNAVNAENYPFYQDLARNIRYFRCRMHYTQKNLADIVGCSEKSISRFENDIQITPCLLETLFSISRALNVKPFELLKPLASNTPDD